MAEQPNELLAAVTELEARQQRGTLRAGGGGGILSRLAPWQRWLTFARAGCLIVGVFLGLGKYGRPLIPQAIVLLVPGGVLLSLHAISMLLGYGRLLTVPRPLATRCQLAFLVAGIGFVGIGMAALTGVHAFRMAAAPAIAMAGMTCLVQALRGPQRCWLAKYMPGRSPFGAYLTCWFFALASPAGIAWCFGLIRLASH
jgi:hypothetical protein